MKHFELSSEEAFDYIEALGFDLSVQVKYPKLSRARY